MSTTTPPHTQTAYKDTTIGKIPADWEVKRFNEIVSKATLGGNYENSEANNGIPVIKMGNIDRGKIILDKVQYLPNNTYYNKNDILKKGDLLFNTRNTLDLVGKVSVWNEDLPLAIYNSNLLKIEFNSQFVASNFFMNYLFNSHKILSQLKSRATGTTSVAAIYTRDLNSIKFPLPPLPEQKQIAEVLSTWDQAIQLTEQLIRQKEQRKKWLMQNLLTGKMRLKGFSGTKWHLRSLGDIAFFQNGKGHENYIVENGAYIVVNSKFISSEGKTIKFSNSNLSPLSKGEIVMVMSDVPNGKALGKCFLIDKNETYTLNQRICSIKAKEGVCNRFLYYILNRNSYFLSFDNGVGQTNIKKDEVLECPLNLPSIEEQIAIAEVLQTADKEIELLKAKAEKLKEQKKGLMQQLLTGKKRLNLNLQD